MQKQKHGETILDFIGKEFAPNKHKPKVDTTQEDFKKTQRELELYNKECWTKIDTLKNEKMSKYASTCNKFQLLNLVYDKINPKESKEYKMENSKIQQKQDKDQDKKKMEDIVAFDFNAFEPKPEEKEKLHSFYRNVFPEVEVSMR